MFGLPDSMYRQAKFAFPTLYRPDAASEKYSYLFP
jgi:hypothetical protein